MRGWIAACGGQWFEGDVTLANINTPGDLAELIAPPRLSHSPSPGAPVRLDRRLPAASGPRPLLKRTHRTMTAIGQDTLKARATLTAGGKSYDYFALTKAAEAYGDISRLPFSMKVLLENMLRFEDGVTVTTEDVKAIIDWQNNPVAPDREIQYRPARVLMQDFTGVPCVVDLAVAFVFIVVVI
eukprot:gene16328-21649_t